MIQNGDNEPVGPKAAKLSVRQSCFKAFFQGKRPAQVIKEKGFRESTVYTYWNRFKKEHPEALSHWQTRPEEDKWDNPRDTVTDTLERIASHLGLPFEMVADTYMKSLKETSQTAQGLASSVQQRKRRRAATILNHITVYTTMGYALDLPPQAVLKILETEGLDFSCFKLHSTSPPGNRQRKVQQ